MNLRRGGGLGGDEPARTRSTLWGAGSQPKLVRGGLWEASGHRGRDETPEEVEAQGSIEPPAGTSRRSCDGLPGGARPCSRARGAAEVAHRRANGKRARAHREMRSLLAKEKAPKGKTPRACAARNRAVEVVAEGRRREGRRTLRAQRSGEANPSTWAAAIASAEGERTPWEAAAPARARSDPVRSHSGEGTKARRVRSRRHQTSPAAACSVEPRRPPAGKVKAVAGTNDPRAERA